MGTTPLITRRSISGTLKPAVCLHSSLFPSEINRNETSPEAPLHVRPADTGIGPEASGGTPCQTQRTSHVPAAAHTSSSGAYTSLCIAVRVASGSAIALLAVGCTRQAMAKLLDISLETEMHEVFTFFDDDMDDKLSTAEAISVRGHELLHELLPLPVLASVPRALVSRSKLRLGSIPAAQRRHHA